MKAYISLFSNMLSLGSRIIYQYLIQIFPCYFCVKITSILLIHGINAYSEDSCLGLPPLCRRCTADCKSRRFFFIILRGFALPLDKSLSSSDEPLELDLISAFSGLKKEVKPRYELQSHYCNIVEQDILLIENVIWDKPL